MPSADGGPGETLDALAEVMGVLRTRCPWDRAQTHGSLRRHLLEEAHEVLEVLDRLAVADSSDGASDELCEELGDLVFQVVFHAHLAAEVGAFDLADVIDGVRTKLVGRHPVIFDPDRADGADWEQAKVREKGRGSVMDGIPSTLPALAYAAKVIGKADTVAPEVPGDLPTFGQGALDEAEWGHVLLGAVAEARRQGIDPESALRTAAKQLEDRVRSAELGSTDPVRH